MKKVFSYIFILILLLVVSMSIFGLYKVTNKFTNFDVNQILEKIENSKIVKEIIYSKETIANEEILFSSKNTTRTIPSRDLKYELYSYIEKNFMSTPMSGSSFIYSTDGIEHEFKKEKAVIDLSVSHSSSFGFLERTEAENNLLYYKFYYPNFDINNLEYSVYLKDFNALSPGTQVVPFKKYEISETPYEIVSIGDGYFYVKVKSDDEKVYRFKYMDKFSITFTTIYNSNNLSLRCVESDHTDYVINGIENLKAEFYLNERYVYGYPESTVYSLCLQFKQDENKNINVFSINPLNVNHSNALIYGNFEIKIIFNEELSKINQYFSNEQDIAIYEPQHFFRIIELGENESEAQQILESIKNQSIESFIAKIIVKDKTTGVNIYETIIEHI